MASRLVSSAGTWLAYVALTVDVYTRTHSSAWVSAVLLADFLPTIAVASLAGPWLDRLPRRTLLIGSELAAGLVFVALPFAPNATAIVALALGAGIASAVFFPSVRAALPSIVDEYDLPRANALSQTVATSGMAAGPVLAGLLVASSGVDTAYALNAASFAVSAALLAQLPALGHSSERDESGYWHEAAAGLRAYFESPALRMILRVWVVAALGGAVINVGEIFLARQAFHAGTFGFGLLATAGGTGIAAGSVLAARITADTATAALRIGLAVAALGFGAAALSPNVWTAASCALVAGSGNALFLAASTLIVQQSTDDAVRGRAFATFDAAGFAAIAVGMATGGAIVAALGA
ncbi:MAG TPA: MFS transporter, partial [Gaiellaceae bacterium]|nr:MFS transporter [Gaiellaceae bacterium]